MGYRDCDICGAPFATHGSACVRPRQVFTAGTTLSTLDMKDAEIAKLRVELEKTKRTLVSLFDDTKAEMTRLRSDLAAARAAHAKDRAVCDRWRSACPEVVSASDGWSSPSWMMAVQALKLEALAHDALRAAEAITVPPNRTGTREESQAIADWHHDEINRRAAEAKGEPK